MLKKVSMYSSALALDTSRSISAWDYFTPTGDDDFNDSDNYETPGNLSYQRSPFFCCDECFCPCPEEPFVRRIVRWVKMIARSKHGMTVLFGVIPLLTGLLIGIYLGRRFEQRQQHLKERKTDITPSRFKKWSTILAKAMHQFTLGFLWLRSLITSVGVYFLGVRWNPKVNNQHQHSGPISRPPQLADQELTENDRARMKLLKNPSCYRQSGVELDLLPTHIAFIMDGNRRYGSAKYKSASRGHIDGGYKLQDVVHWCLEECIQEITVYAFSTENWNRSQTEIDALMSIFCQQCEELRRESVKLQIVVRVLSTETDPIPEHVKEKLKQLEDDTKNCEGSLFLNVCLSYGSRGEIVRACRSLATDCLEGKLSIHDISEQALESRLLTHRSSSPDILLRTSGEVRISNFLLWQCAYSEFFFLSKHWPELQKEDLLEVIRAFAHGRKRRFGS